MIIFFIILQIVLLFFMLFHDWISVPPFNDVSALKKRDSNLFRLFGSTINGVAVLIPLATTLIHFQNISIAASIILVICYLLLTIGTILSWWVPYFFGSSQNHKQRFSKFQNTHHFLPQRADNVAPNTLHLVLHLQIWLCLGISVYFLVKAIG